MRKKAVLGSAVTIGVAVTAAFLGEPLAGSAPASAQQASISGTVTLEPPPAPRRTANRYPGSPTTTRLAQHLPAVVYLRGTVPGSSGGGTVEMAQRDTSFVPSGLTVTVGTTVSFPNQDPFFHNVFSYSGAKEFDLGRYPEGQTKEVHFDRPGVVELFCEVHDFMRGLVVVTENPYHAVVADDGTFSIGGVPPGEYTLVAWHPEHDEVERSVTVSDGSTTRVEVELRR